MRWIAWICLACAPCMSGCLLPVLLTYTPQQDMPTVPGPESPRVLEGLAGAADRDAQLLQLALCRVRLPKETSVLAGPDRLGRVAWLDTHEGWLGTRGERFSVHLFDLQSGQDRVVYEERVSVDRLAHIELSEDGASIAVCLREAVDRAAARRTWIELIDANSGALRWTHEVSRLGPMRIGGTPARLFHEHPGRPMAHDGFLESAVWALDLAGQSEQRIAAGELVALSPQGDRLLIMQHGDGGALPRRGRVLQMRSSATGEELSLAHPPPGLMWGAGVRAWLADDRVLYDALPTEGTKQRAHHYFGLTGPKGYWSLKVADLRSGEFATLEPYFWH